MGGNTQARGPAVRAISSQPSESGKIRIVSVELSALRMTRLGGNALVRTLRIRTSRDSGGREALAITVFLFSGLRIFSAVTLAKAR